MKLKAVLFDLDGTLLPMDQETFIKAYFSRLAAKMAPHGYDPQQLIGAIWAGTTVMIRNNGTQTNEEAFWEEFARQLGERVLLDKPLLEEYYRTDFQKVQQVCGFDPRAGQIIALLKDRGVRRILATNPIFPAVATQSRIRWAGLTPEDFELYTTYENSSFCKPNPEYYRQILDSQGLAPEECLMVGNDVKEDMVAQTLGMQVFLLTDCLINPENMDVSRYPNGGFEALLSFLERQL